MHNLLEQHLVPNRVERNSAKQFRLAGGNLPHRRDVVRHGDALDGLPRVAVELLEQKARIGLADAAAVVVECAKRVLESDTRLG